MQRRKIVVRILLVLSVINFVLAAPVLVRGILREVAEDVTTASQRRWNSKSLEQKLGPNDPRTPIMGRDSNAYPQPRGGSDAGNSHTLPVGPPPPPPSDLPSSGIDLNALPQPEPGQEPTDGPDSGSHSMDSPTYSGSYHSTDTMAVSPSPGYNAETRVPSESPSSAPLHDSNPPPWHGDLPETFYNIFYNRPLSGPAKSDPGPQRPYSSTASDSGLPLSDTGPSRMPDSPSDSRQSTGAYYPPLDSEPSTPHGPQDPGPWPHDAEKFFSDLLRSGRFKRGNSNSRSGQRELQDTLDSREYVPASAFPLP
jgi:hypothetical protein